MVKLTVGGVDIQQWVTAYACQCPPINGSSGFYDQDGCWVSDKKGDEVTLDITLEEVPTQVSEELARVLEAAEVDVDYTTPVPRHGKFYKTAYTANYDDSDYPNEMWTIQLSLRSAGLISPSGGL